MYETGEHAIGAAARLGITVNALEKWCLRHDCNALFRRMFARNPQPIEEYAA